MHTPEGQERLSLMKPFEYCMYIPLILSLLNLSNSNKSFTIRFLLSVSLSQYFSIVPKEHSYCNTVGFHTQYHNQQRAFGEDLDEDHKRSGAWLLRSRFLIGRSNLHCIECDHMHESVRVWREHDEWHTYIDMYVHMIWVILTEIWNITQGIRNRPRHHIIINLKES